MNCGHWVWLAMDVETRGIVSVYIGFQSEMSVYQLWKSLSAVYRRCGLADTDFWDAYRAVLPRKRHQAVGKETSQTSYIKRFNNTLRQ